MSLSTGQVDTGFLHQSLKRWTDKKKKNQLLVGCFSAGSNITGAVTDDVEVTQLLHEFDALAIWDYAAAAPHVKIEMNPICRSRSSKVHRYDINGNDSSAFKDAIFFSGHKFLGGPQTPGVLVVKKHVLQNPIPHGMGGGTVLFTTKRGHHYLEEPNEREEGGTPNIVGSIRLGLVFRLRNQFGVKNIVEIEAAICRQVLDEWSQIPEIHILGHNNKPRLPIISFMIKHLKSGYYLHHNFVVALLNDLFGIQCRGGCMCAGPYAQDLLGIDDKLASFYEDTLKNQKSSVGTGVKPGFVRISLNYHSSQEEVNFIIKSVKLIARNGWKLLPFYRMDWKTSSFIFNGQCSDEFNTSLISLTLLDQMIGSNVERVPSRFNSGTDFLRSSNNVSTKEYLDQAKRLLASSCIYSSSPQDDDFYLNSLARNRHLKKLRWFILPSEVAIFQQYGSSLLPDYFKSQMPFKPVSMGNSNFNSFHSSTPGQLQPVWNKYDRTSLEEVRKLRMLTRTWEFYPKTLHNTTKYQVQRHASDQFSGKMCERENGNDFSNEVSSGFEDDDDMTQT